MSALASAAALAREACALAALAGFEGARVASRGDEVVLCGADGLGTRLVADGERIWTGFGAPPAGAAVPHPADIAVASVLAACGAEAAEALTFEPARDGPDGCGPIDAVAVGATRRRSGVEGASWTLEVVRVPHTRCHVTRVALPYRPDGRRARPDEVRAAMARLWRGPAFAESPDTARTTETMRDLGFGARFPLLAALRPEHEGDDAPALWLASTQGCVVAALADLVGRLCAPQLGAGDVRGRIDDALQARAAREFQAPPLARAQGGWR